MRTVQELMTLRESLLAQMIEVDKEIARHPDVIRDMFKHNPSWDMVGFEELVNKITFAKHTTIPAKGIVVEYEETAYRIYTDMTDDRYFFGRIGEEKELDWKVVDALWAQDEPIGYLSEKGIVGADVVGYLLTASL